MASALNALPDSNPAAPVAASPGFFEEVRRALPGCNDAELRRAVEVLMGGLQSALPEPSFSILRRQWPAGHFLARPEGSIDVGVNDRRPPESLVGVVNQVLSGGFPHHACAVVRVALSVLANRIASPDLISVVAATPSHLRKLWPPEYWRDSHLDLSPRAA